MPTPGPTLALATGTQEQLTLPNGRWPWIVMYNLSPFLLTVGFSGGQMSIPPWWAEALPLPSSAQALQISASSPGAMAIPVGTPEQLTTVLYTIDDPVPVGFPVTLTANAIVATVGGTVTITGNVSVIPAAGAVFATLPVLAAGAVAGQTGAGSTLPANPLEYGVTFTALKANANPIYIGPPGVTTGTGLELQAGMTSPLIPVANTDLLAVAGTPGDKVSWLAA